jgi:hypothetical protein
MSEYTVGVSSEKYKDHKFTSGTVSPQSGIVLDWRVTHKHFDFAATRYFNHGKPALAEVVESNNPRIREAIFDALFISCPHNAVRTQEDAEHEEERLCATAVLFCGSNATTGYLLLPSTTINSTAYYFTLQAQRRTSCLVARERR